MKRKANKAIGAGVQPAKTQCRKEEKDAAKTEATKLQNSSEFYTLFDDTYSFVSCFDHYVRIQLLTKELSTAKLLVKGSNKKNAAVESVMKNIRDAMSERYEEAGVLLCDNEITEDSFAFMIGFRISKQWSNPITVGPVANETAAANFRQFWCGASQLRKFADTRISECMVWAEEATPIVPLSIIRFLLEKKMSIPATAASFRSMIPGSFLTNREISNKLNVAFASLSGTLRSLKGLPLMITNIHGISPYLRGTEPNIEDIICPTTSEMKIVGDHQVPNIKKIPKYTPSVQVFLKLEYSGKWGNDAEAIRRLTASFYIQIAEQLQKHEMIAVPSMDQLFIMKDQIVFRLVIVHDKIQKILEDKVNTLRSSGASRIENTPAGKRLAWYNKKYVSELLLQQSLGSFSTKHLVFSDTVQITKKWLANHFLSDAIPDLALEMVVAAAIESAENAPGSPYAAFRRVLHLICTQNWTALPLIVDFDGAWTEDDRVKIESEFIKMRPVLPPMVIITNEDTVGTKWTKNSPTPLLLKRVIALASATLKTLDEGIRSSEGISIKSALSSNDLSIYDCILELHGKTVARRVVEQDEMNAENGKKTRSLPVVDFDPVDELIYALNAHFGSVALFFYNKYDGSQIGVKFKPLEEEVRSNISRCHLHKTSKSKGILAINREEVLEGINIIGRGIIKGIRANC